MKLILKRPLVFLDIETTGTNVTSDRIVEISLLKANPDGTKETFTRRVNPTIPISPGATKVHGIRDEDVANEPVFAEIAGDIHTFIDGCDLAGYNSNRFDIPMLAEEFIRAAINFTISGRQMIDVQNIFHKMEPRTLSAAYRFYCDKELSGAHGAEADANATFEVLLAQIEKYPELKHEVDDLSEFSSYGKTADLMGRISFDKEGAEIFNFGKYKGKRVEEVFKMDMFYYNWMMRSEFPQFTKKVITEIKERMI